ncbi:MAG: hypothetical protein M3Q10_06800 [Chloroflexota bacterium]|nr:hypothetical protein [Chloroflexota bacterium]
MGTTSETSGSKTALSATREDAQHCCLCGCGGQPKGKKSRYVQGHDAKHRSQLLRQMRGHADRGAADELVRLAWLTPSAAATEIGEALVRNGESKAAR